MIFFPLLGSYFGIVDMVDLWPRQPAEIWKMSLINLLQWKYFEIWGRQNWTALSSCTTLYVIFKLSNLQIPQLQNRDNNIQVYSRLIVCVPPRNSICWNLTLNVMILGGGDLERLLNHEGGTLMNGLSVSSL